MCAFLIFDSFIFFNALDQSFRLCLNKCEFIAYLSAQLNKRPSLSLSFLNRRETRSRAEAHQKGADQHPEGRLAIWNGDARDPGRVPPL